MDTDKAQKLAPPPPNQPQMSADNTQIPSPPHVKADYPHREVTEKIIGAAFEVHREVGPGFLEKVYETALIQELKEGGVHAQGQAEITVSYEGQPIGSYYADIFVDGRVICEIKAVQTLAAAHEAQLLHYLKATATEVGLLLNFGADRVQVKRLVRSR